MLNFQKIKIKDLLFFSHTPNARNISRRHVYLTSMLDEGQEGGGSDKEYIKNRRPS